MGRARRAILSRLGFFSSACLPLSVGLSNEIDWKLKHLHGLNDKLGFRMWLVSDMRLSRSLLKVLSPELK